MQQFLQNHYQKPALALLIDPDKTGGDFFDVLTENIDILRPDMFFVGGSVIEKTVFEQTVSKLKQLFPAIPVILFPGNQYQLSAEADGILMLSLVSGRNPEYLISQQVAAAPFIEAAALETYPTAYILIDGGRTSSTAYITQTVPIPADKPDIAAITALAAKQLGMQYVYLEAGSGAKFPVSSAMIKAVKAKTGLPVITGGGIRTAEDAEKAVNAGADIIVIGTLFEHSPEQAASIRTALDKIQFQSLKAN